MPNVRAIAGQLFVRKLTEGTVIIGTFKSQEKAPLVEGAAYVAMLTASGLVIAATPLDNGLPFHLEGQGIKAAIEAPIWHRVMTPGAVIVRAFQSFEDSNWWTVYGVSDAGLGELVETDHAGHGWLNLTADSVRNIPAPISAIGLAVSQPLGYAIWPGPGEERWRLPEHPPRWCARYHELSLRLAAAGADAAKAPEIIASLRRDPRLGMIAPYNPEPAYLAYLAAMKAAGHLFPSAPKTAAEESAAEAWRREYMTSRMLERMAA